MKFKHGNCCTCGVYSNQFSYPDSSTIPDGFTETSGSWEILDNALVTSSSNAKCTKQTNNLTFNTYYYGSFKFEFFITVDGEEAQFETYPYGGTNTMEKWVFKAGAGGTGQIRIMQTGEGYTWYTLDNLTIEPGQWNTIFYENVTPSPYAGVPDPKCSPAVYHDSIYWAGRTFLNGELILNAGIVNGFGAYFETRGTVTGPIKFRNYESWKIFQECCPCIEKNWMITQDIIDTGTARDEVYINISGATAPNTALNGTWTADKTIGAFDILDYYVTGISRNLGANGTVTSMEIWILYYYWTVTLHGTGAINGVSYTGYFNSAANPTPNAVSIGGLGFGLPGGGFIGNCNLEYTPD